MKAYNTPNDTLTIKSDEGEELVKITPEKTTIANLEGGGSDYEVVSFTGTVEDSGALTAVTDVIGTEEDANKVVQKIFETGAPVKIHLTESVVGWVGADVFAQPFAYYRTEPRSYYVAFTPFLNPLTSSLNIGYGQITVKEVSGGQYGLTIIGVLIDFTTSG